MAEGIATLMSKEPSFLEENWLQSLAAGEIPSFSRYDGDAHNFTLEVISRCSATINDTGANIYTRGMAATALGRTLCGVTERQHPMPDTSTAALRQVI